MSRLLCLTNEDIDLTLEDLHSIIDVPKDDAQPRHLHHPSFRDFLFDENRCEDSNFRVNKERSHEDLAHSCMQLMSKTLKQDICNLETPGMLVAGIDGGRVERSLPLDVQYACLYWIQHLQECGAEPRDNDQVHQFLQKHLLHWFEALGWMRKVSEGIHAIMSLESLARVRFSSSFDGQFD